MGLRRRAGSVIHAGRCCTQRHRRDDNEARLARKQNRPNHSQQPVSLCGCSLVCVRAQAHAHARVVCPFAGRAWAWMPTSPPPLPPPQLPGAGDGGAGHAAGHAALGRAPPRRRHRPRLGACVRACVRASVCMYVCVCVCVCGRAFECACERACGPRRRRQHKLVVILVTMFIAIEEKHQGR